MLYAYNIDDPNRVTKEVHEVLEDGAVPFGADLQKIECSIYFRDADGRQVGRLYGRGDIMRDLYWHYRDCMSSTEPPTVIAVHN